jgi:putative acetyltransferase
VEIVVDDLSGAAAAALVAEHLAEMRATSPPGSVHALDLDRLRGPGVTVWTVLDGGAVAGMGALLLLDARHGEIKSMRTAASHRGRGVATALLRHIVAEARRRGLARLSLETGAEPHFAAARALYARHGFVPCPPFADYTDDPNSAYFTLEL